MTREEALAYAISQKAGMESEIHRTPFGYGNWAVYSTGLDFVNAAISALRRPTRERVEKMRASLEPETLPDGTKTVATKCSKCGAHNLITHLFCWRCGSPLTDRAVDILAKRLEEVLNA